MQYRGFRSFCVAARHLSFKAAADELCITPSAVSHQIRDLEDALGQKLFIRDTRAVRLTAAGRQLFDDLIDHITAIDEAVARLRNRAVRQTLGIEMPAFFASELFLPQVGHFSSANQHIDLRIQTREPGEPQSTQPDLNVVLSRRRPSTERAELLFPIRYQPACGSACAEAWKTRPLQEIARATLIVHEARPEAWDEWMKLSDVSRHSSAQTITVDSMYDLARAAQKGLGVALIPMPVSRQWFSSGQLVPLFDLELQSQDSYWITTNAKPQQSEPIDTLWSWIVNEFRPTAEETSPVG